MNIVNDSLFKLKIDASNHLASFNYYERVADLQSEEVEYQAAKQLADQAYVNYRQKEDAYWAKFHSRT